MLSSGQVQRGVNWIPGKNPFQLLAPPNWFLDDLWVFDDQLVIVPSQVQAVYRITRRTRRSAGLRRIATLAQGMDIHPDTKLMADQRLVPVATLAPTLGWSSQILVELARRDVWRAGGPKAAADILDAQDKAREQSIDAKCVDELTERVNRSYESYRYRTGQRLSLTTPEPPVSANVIVEEWRALKQQEGAQVRTPAPRVSAEPVS